MATIARPPIELAASRPQVPRSRADVLQERVRNERIGYVVIRPMGRSGQRTRRLLSEPGTIDSCENRRKLEGTCYFCNEQEGVVE